MSVDSNWLLATSGPEQLSNARKSAHAFVRDSLRRAILDGSLTGGTRLFQSKVADMLGVSTTPVREAFRELASEGLLTMDAHRGVKVRRIDAVELREIYDVRLLLEPPAARLAAVHIDADGLERAGRLLDRVAQEKEPVTWARLNNQFHATLVDGCGSERLAGIIRSLQETAAAYVVTAIQSGVALHHHNEQHTQLMEAMRDRDGERAAEVTAAHLRDTLELLVRLASEPAEPARD